jgi:dimethylhistidine N-methyltransferase
MPPHSTKEAVKRDAEHAPESTGGFARDVAVGLARAQKQLPCQYFYDARGSELFEEITRLPEYYPTGVEIGILRNCVSQLARQLPGKPLVLVEFGSGSSLKTEILLEALPAIACYMPIDVSWSALEGAAARLSQRFPHLAVRPVVADFTRPIAIPADIAHLERLGFFPGSTIGNFEPDDAIDLLAAIRVTLSPRGHLLIGADLKKDLSVLLPAYDDAAGVTAAFNLNLLERINRELNGNFDLSRFRHQARYDHAKGRIEMHLESLCDQVVTVGNQRFRFTAGETIHTENSHKFTVEEFQKLSRRAGWQVLDVWTDPRQYFSEHHLTTS